MVRLDRIYTKTGDDGTTALGDGQRVPKHHLRVAAYGTVDELSAILGLALAVGLEDPYRGDLLDIQNDLFDVGADLCVPGAPSSAPRELPPQLPGDLPAKQSATQAAKKRERLRITPEYTRRLEGIIDRENEVLAPLKSFILPGGTLPSAWLHFARNVCRRAERLVTQLAAEPGERGRVNPEVIYYLNRLSDLLFVLGRVLNESGARDVLWKPGKNQA